MEIGYKLTYPFNSVNVFKAFEFVVANNKAYKIDKIDTQAGTMLIKSGMSLTSWGEDILFTFIAFNDVETTFSLYANPKFGNDALTKAKCQKRVDDLIDKVQQALVLHVNGGNNFKVINHSVESETQNLDSNEKPQTAEEAYVQKLKQKMHSLSLTGFETFLGRKEIKYIPEVLMEGEEVEALVQGTMEDKNGILFVSNKRLIFLDRGLMYGTKLHTYLLSQVGGIEFSSGLIFSKIKIHSSGKPETTIDHVVKDQGKRFVDYVNKKLVEISDAKNTLSPPVFINQNSVSDELAKLASLKTSGVLTDEEFANAKAKLLSNL